MATIRPQSYQTIAARVLEKSAVEIAKQLETAYYGYEGHSDGRLTQMMLSSISNQGHDEDTDYKVAHRIMVDYAMKQGMSSFIANKIVNISLGSEDGVFISSEESHARIPEEIGGYYSTVLAVLNGIISSLKVLGVGKVD